MLKLNFFLENFSKRCVSLIGILIVLNIVFGSWYLVVLMDKVKANDTLIRISKENSQLNADISRIKLEIDKKVDLATIKERATSELQMELISEVKYIVVDE